jgi:hypothetical protein
LLYRGLLQPNTGLQRVLHSPPAEIDKARGAVGWLTEMYAFVAANKAEETRIVLDSNLAR